MQNLHIYPHGNVQNLHIAIDNDVQKIPRFLVGFFMYSAFLFLIGFFAHCLYIIEKLDDEHIRNKNNKSRNDARERPEEKSEIADDSLAEEITHAECNARDNAECGDYQRDKLIYSYPVTALFAEETVICIAGISVLAE